MDFSCTNWLMETPHGTSSLTLPLISQATFPQNNHQVVVNIKNQEIPVIVIDNNITNLVECNIMDINKLENTSIHSFEGNNLLETSNVMISKSELMPNNNDSVKREMTLEDWTEISVKEDLNMYKQEMTNQELVKEWTDWPELEIKREIKLEDESPEDQSDIDETMLFDSDIFKCDKNLYDSRESNERRIRQNINEEMYEVSFMTHAQQKSLKKEENEQIKTEGEGKFQCKYCLYRTKWKGNLTKHVISRHTASEEIKWFECAHCSYKGKTRDYLRWHLNTVHEKFIKWHDCPHCSFKAKMKCVLDKHILTTHTSDDKIKWFKCDHCSYKAKVGKNLKNHVISKHTDLDEIHWFKCDQCSFKAKHKKNLKFHMINLHTEHDKIQWYKCDKCSYQVKAKKNLKWHIDKYHSGRANNLPKCNTKEVPVLIGNSICWKRVPVEESMNKPL